MATLDNTVRMLREHPEPMTKVAAAVGVSVRWLQYMRAGAYTAPDIQRVERLHAYLMTYRQVAA